MKTHKLTQSTVAEYIQREKDNGLKYEYHDGEIFAMEGGSYNHGLLCGNIYAEMRRALRAKGNSCKPLSSEIKLYIATKNNYVHPDSMVVCGEVNKADDDKNAVTNPTLIVEVLSKSTADYDRGDKFHTYRQIPEFKEYVLIDQYKEVVEVFYKPDHVDLWKISRYEGLAAIIELESIGIAIKMSDLYFDVDEL